jgi:uncharacterized protein YbjQ (UPF0145 family)
MAIEDEDFESVVDEVLSGEPERPPETIGQRPAKSAIVVTTPFVGPKSIARTIGPVTAQCCIAAGMRGDLKVAFRDAFGGRCRDVERIVAGMQSDLIQKLSGRAVALGANAVIGTQMTFTEFAENVFMGTAFGTAIITKD